MGEAMTQGKSAEEREEKPAARLPEETPGAESVPTSVLERARKQAQATQSRRDVAAYLRMRRKV